MTDGKVYAGIVKAADEERIRLQLPDGQSVELETALIEERTTGKSGMPEDLVKKLSKGEIRDLVEYLSTLKSTKKSESHGDQ